MILDKIKLVAKSLLPLIGIVLPRCFSPPNLFLRACKSGFSPSSRWDRQDKSLCKLIPSILLWVTLTNSWSSSSSFSFSIIIVGFSCLSFDRFWWSIHSCTFVFVLLILSPLLMRNSETLFSLDSRCFKFQSCFLWR